MVTFMDNSGFCAGVRRAVENTEKLYEDVLAGTQVYLYGDLVNNAYVMHSFRDKGFRFIDPDKPEEIDLIPEGSIVVIRAHGVSRAIEEKFNERNVIIKDYTCGKVKKVHNIVAAESSQMNKIIVVGDSAHPEVIGISGWSSTPVQIVMQESDLDSLDLTGKLCVVAQTTCDVELWENVSNRILTQNPAARIFNTLCTVISDREATAKEIAASAGIMFVIGDSDSSNSKRLYKQCYSVNKNTFPITSLFRLNPPPAKPPYVESLSDLEENQEIAGVMQRSLSIGLAAGASTPDKVIYAARDYLLFKEFIKFAKAEIEAASRKYTDDYCASAADNAYVQSALNDLRNQNEGGKRIRGAMIKLGERIASHGKNNHYLPIAVGYELFQTSVLIHDDIIDKGDTRRNKATIHVESSKRIKESTDISDAGACHYGVSRALCVGDYGFFMSYQFLAKCEIGSSDLVKVYSLYSKILATTCEGEIMDSLLPFDKISIADDYDEYMKIVTQIYEYKTAWYTLAGPIMLGAICGGGSDRLVGLLRGISIPLGIAFQMKDDLLGIFSSKDVLGKSVLSDIRENKQTLMFGYAYKHADNQQRALLDRHYGKADADEVDLEIIRELFEEIGAKEYMESEIQRLSESSRNLITNDMIDSECQAILNGLINYLIGRNF